MKENLSTFMFVAIVFAGATFLSLLRLPRDDEGGTASRAVFCCCALAMYSSLMAAGWFVRAMHSSLMAAAGFVRAPSGDGELADIAVEFGVAFIGIAALLMSVAAALRACIVAGKLGWAPIFVLGMGVSLTVLNAMMSRLMLALVVRARWSRMLSVLLRRAG